MGYDTGARKFFLGVGAEAWALWQVGGRRVVGKNVPALCKHIQAGARIPAWDLWACTHKW